MPVANNKSMRTVYAAIALFFAVFFLAYFPTASLLHGYWSEMTEAYAHGYVMVLVTIYLIYERRDKIFRLDETITRGYFIVACLAVFGISSLWFVANATQVLIIQFVCVVVLYWLWLAAVFGKSAAIYAALPVGLMFLAIPLWDGMGVTLRNLTVYATQTGLNFFSINAFINGYFIQIPDGVIEVASSCSGLKYFLAGTSLAIIYAELNFITIQRKILVIVSGLVISLVANWIRVFSLVVIADYSKMQSSLVYDHENFGWLVFTISFTVFILAVGRVAPGERKKNPVIKETLGRQSNNNYIRNAFIVTMIATSLPVLSWCLTTESENNGLTHKLQLEGVNELNAANWLPDFSGYDEVNSWRVNERVDVSILSYRKQEQGKELIYYKNKINKNSENKQSLDVSSNVNVNVSQLRFGDKSRLVVWYYRIGDKQTNNDTVAKLLQLLAIFKGVPVASLVTISTECGLDDCTYERSQVLTRSVLEKIMGSIVLTTTENSD